MYYTQNAEPACDILFTFVATCVQKLNEKFINTYILIFCKQFAKILSERFLYEISIRGDYAETYRN